jgi:hypothetical protein
MSRETCGSKFSIYSALFQVYRCRKSKTSSNEYYSRNSEYWRNENYSYKSLLSIGVTGITLNIDVQVSIGVTEI